MPIVPERNFVMNPAIALMSIYILITAGLQAVGFLVSRLVEMIAPAAGLITFLILYLAMFWIAWPIAVRLTETYIPGARPDGD
jgi:hypothetical protein